MRGGHIDFKLVQCFSSNQDVVRHVLLHCKVSHHYNVIGFRYFEGRQQINVPFGLDPFSSQTEQRFSSWQGCPKQTRSRWRRGNDYELWTSVKITWKKVRMQRMLKMEREQRNKSSIKARSLKRNNFQSCNISFSHVTLDVSFPESNLNCSDVVTLASFKII